MLFLNLTICQEVPFAVRVLPQAVYFFSKTSVDEQECSAVIVNQTGDLFFQFTFIVNVEPCSIILNQTCMALLDLAVSQEVPLTVYVSGSGP